MIEIIKIENPFDRTRREIECVDFLPGKHLTEYVSGQFDYLLNGNVVEQPELTIPCDGDQIIVLPHVGKGLKRVLSVVATLALMSYAGSISSGSTGIFGVSHATLSTYLAAGAVMYVGGRVINTVFGVDGNALTPDQQTSSTYGWDTPKPITGEGGVVGVTYGECIPAPQVLERHIDTVNDKQYLCMLLCGGQGPVDVISDIKVAGNPIEYYSDVSVDVRYGTNDQTVIPNFGDTTSNVEISAEIKDNTWVTYQSDNSDAQGLQITVELPSGLYHVEDNGNLSNASVTLAGQYRLVGAADWTPWLGGNYIASTSIADAACYSTAPAETWTITVSKYYSVKTGNYTVSTDVSGSVSGRTTGAVTGQYYDNGKIKCTIPSTPGTYTIKIANDAQISAAQNTAVRRSYRIDNLTTGKYEVRLQVTSRSAATSTRNMTTIYWTRLTSIMYEDFCRPNKVLVGLRILATSQLSSSQPDVTWRQIRYTIYAWNPNTGAYETKSARNPIWAAYDIYHQCRYLKNINTGLFEYTVFGVAHSRLDPYWDEWVAAAAYADEQVLGTDGTTYENRFEFDAHYDTVQKRYTAAQKAAAVGHATILPRGNNIGIVVDKPGTMTQVFGQGRTVMSSVKGTFTGTEDRAKSVEVIFPDTNNDFANTTFLVRSPDWATSAAVNDNPTQLQLFGVKRRSQAYREGVYTLANNLLITQFVDIGTDIDALVCQYGDIVGYAHSVSQIGIASGMIVSATATTVTIDTPVELTAGVTYEIIISLSTDKIVKRYVQAAPQSVFVTPHQTVDMGTYKTDVLTVTEPFDVVPERFDNYVFGDVDKSCKKFRLVSVERDGDLRCTLKLAEYNEGVYSGDLNYPVIDYTPAANKIFEVDNLNLAEETYVTVDGVRVTAINAAWTAARQADGFLVYYSIDGINYKYWERTNLMESTITGIIPGKTYWIKVCVEKNPIQSAGSIKTLYVAGRDVNPPDVSTVMVERLTAGYRFTFSLAVDPPVDLAGYRIKYNVGSSAWWQSAIPLHSGLILASPFETNALPAGTVTILIKAVDNAGNESTNVASAVIGLGDVIVDNVIETIDFKAMGWPGTKTNCHVNSDGDLVADDSGDLFYSSDDAPMYPGNDSSLFYRTTWPAMTYEQEFTPTDAGYLSFDANIDGNAVINYRRENPYAMYGADYDLVYSDDNASMYKTGPYVAYAGKVATTVEPHQIKIEIPSGTVQGIIRSLAAVIDVPDESETLNDIAISASGTRLPIVKSYREIKNVNITLQEVNGVTAYTAKIIDKSTATGPLVKCYNTVGAAVAGVVDAIIQGVKG